MFHVKSTLRYIVSKLLFCCLYVEVNYCLIVEKSKHYDLIPEMLMFQIHVGSGMG